MTPVIRTVLFWVMMIALATVLWKMASQGGKDQGPTRQMSYSEFMGQVDARNIASAKLLLSPSTAEVQGTLCQGSARYSTTIPKEVITDLTERLRKQGVVVEVAETRHGDSLNILVSLVPFLVIVVIWIFRSRAMRTRQGPPASAPPQNQPLGD